MKTLLAALLLLGPSAQADPDFEDRPEVKKIIETPEITLQKCSGGRFRLGGSCVVKVETPLPVAQEVLTMKTQQLDNDSDYDVRITQLLVVNHERDLSRIKTSELKGIINTLGVPAETEMEISLVTEGMDFQNYLGGLSINGQYKLEANTHRYLTKLLKGKPSMMVDFMRHVYLHPGGGFYGQWYVVITEEHLVYVKVVGWDS